MRVLLNGTTFWETQVYILEMQSCLGIPAARKRKEMDMPPITLTDFVETTAKQFTIPGVAVGVWVDGQEIYACHGVTSLDNPLPIDQDTLFILGSVTKTYTATTLMRLVAEGKVELHAPVRRYLPELRLKDQQAAEAITMLNLLNHTSGLDWGITFDTGEGDDALERYVAKMVELEQIAPPGTRVSYSEAGYNLVGRIIEQVTGQTFEQAVAAVARRQPRRRHRLLGGRPAALGPLPSGGRSCGKRQSGAACSHPAADAGAHG